MPHTFIILNGHPNAFAQLPRIENSSVPPTHLLPPLPLWASMVQSTIEHCRVAWDLEQTRPNIINVMVAGGSPIEINKITEQNTNILNQRFPHAQPRENYSHDRLQPTIELALKNYANKEKSDTLRRCRIMLVLVAKRLDEKLFQFYNNAEDPCRNLRSMVYDALNLINRQNPSNTISHVEVDIVRLLPYSESPQQRVPPKIISKRISPSITMSVYNIPNGPNDLKYAMRNLTQLYYNVNILHISNIPMKSEENRQSTQTVSFYYQANGKHLINQQEPFSNAFLHDPKYLKSRELNLVYSKRSKKALPDSEWCTCMHSISPIKLQDLATEVYLDMTFKGSVSYLVTHETSTSWSHILMAQDGGIFFHCLNSQLQTQFVQVKNDSIDVVLQPKKELDSKALEMVETIIKPSLYENVNEFLMSTATVPACKVVPINPFRYSHHLQITTLNEKGLKTARWVEKSTRWRTCFRDCLGTDMFPISLDSDRSIADLAEDVLNGVPVSSGFGIAFGLIHDLLEQLQDVLLKDKIPKKSISVTEKLIHLIVTQLIDGVSGKNDKSFIKGLRKVDAQLLSKRLLVGLYIVGKRFKRDSETHEQLCTFMLSFIDEKTSMEEGENIKNEDPTRVKSEHDMDIDTAWNQVNRYENMSLREKEDAAQGFLPDFKKEKDDTSRVFKGQLPPKVNTPPLQNPNFKSRRSGPPPSASTTADPYNKNKARNQPVPTKPRKELDSSVAVPYLTYIAPTLEEKAEEEAAEEESLGTPGNLLWLHWMGEKLRKRGNTEEGDLSSGTELVYKNSQWKRVKKEFFGRTAQPGEQGEML
ncbi:unnamed protein product [Mucor hiemalis]